MSDTILRVSELRAGYDDFIIDEVTFNLDSGSIMGLLGKSGSGKSTLIKALLGLIPIQSGHLWVSVDDEERELNDVAGYSPQENALYPFLTIRENFRVFSKLRGVDSETARKRMVNSLDKLGIFEARDKRVSQLSGGMAKRADLAMAMLHDPEIIVLDEPFSGIDPPQRDIIWDTIEDFADEGKIVILTSHMLPDLMERCNEYGLVHKGGYHNTGELEKLRDRTEYENMETMMHDVFRL